MVSGTASCRWVRPIFGTLTDMTSFADQVVVATKSESVILSADGRVLKQLGPWTVGGLGNQIWSYAGDGDRAPVNRMFLQPFLSYQATRPMPGRDDPRS